MRFSIESRFFETGEDAPALEPNENWSLSVFGNNESIDDRSAKACEFIRSISEQSFTFFLDIQNNNFLIDNQLQNAGVLKMKLQGHKKIILDATTLTYPEILIVLDAACKAKVKNITFLYVEPVEYRRKVGFLSDYRSFTLSENPLYRAIPKFNINLNTIEQGRVVFFLGYEESRLRQAFEQQETLAKWAKSAVFGIPAFSFGMELDSIANNAQVITNDFSTHYVAASSASGAYKLLNKLRTDDKADKPIAVIPLGTKPHAIGAALFVIEHNQGDNAITIFDHPNKSSGRTKSIKRWHFYEVKDRE